MPKKNKVEKVKPIVTKPKKPKKPKVRPLKVKIPKGMTKLPKDRAKAIKADSAARHAAETPSDRKTRMDDDCEEQWGGRPNGTT